jgi:cytoskeletal protein CcmA (bactofilin family)
VQVEDDRDRLEGDERERAVMSDAKRTGGPRTLVEEGTQLKGSMTSKCPIDVKGKVEGDLSAPSLSVSVSGAVQGRVKVDELVSEGEISGEVDADVVRLSGVVKDNTVLRAKSLEVKLGPANGKRMQVVFGECVLEIGEAPTREAEVKKEEGKAAAAPANSAAPAEGERPRSIPSAPPPGMA